MIEYKLDKEKEILIYYANILDDKIVLDFLKKNYVSNKDEVKVIAKFYWSLVDLSTKEDEENIGKYENMEMWLERIYTSLHIYFCNEGYDEVWDNEIP